MYIGSQNLLSEVTFYYGLTSHYLKQAHTVYVVIVMN